VRFLSKVWQVGEYLEGNKKDFQEKIRPLNKQEIYSLDKSKNKTIKKVTEDIEALRFNTAISSLMEYVNQLNVSGRLISKNELKEHVKTLIVLLSPFAPHICEQIWHQMLKKSRTIQFEPWPKYVASFLEDKTFDLVIQVNGKVRSKILVNKTISENQAKELALKDPKILSFIKNKKIKKSIYISGRLINLVI
ncbi:MAG: class I tRNA ligase family protein, partial [Candidatus Parcubacteria bacterium]|nr:class I tRNA ligase family protein [Candidatus Parcubacteria bacterium]